MSMDPIRIGVAHRGAGLAPVFAALDGGCFAEVGLAPELIFLPGHPAALAALLAGEVDVINTVGPELLLANHRHGGDAVVIASAISRSAVQISARPELASLRGARWGCNARGDADECAMLMALDAWGWDPAVDARMVEVGSGAPRLELLLDAARVDVAVMHAPEAFQAQKRGWRIVEDLGRMDIAIQNSCAAITRRLLAARPDTARRYARAYAHAVWRFRTDAAFGLEVLARNTGEADRAVLGQTWLLFARLMGGMIFPSVEGMRNAAGLLHRLGQLPEAAPPEASIDLGPITALEQQGGFFEIMGVPPAWRSMP
jgi:ABC-type nitrate/sulfonate/bicarbonate transport system substrate-binding protein